MQVPVLRSLSQKTDSEVRDLRFSKPPRWFSRDAATPGLEEEVWGLRVWGRVTPAELVLALLTWLLPTQMFFTAQMMLSRKPSQKVSSRAGQVLRLDLGPR